MANSQTDSGTGTGTGTASRASRRHRLPMSPCQLQAYFMARETLRRLKPAPTPIVPRDFSPGDKSRSPS